MKTTTWFALGGVMMLTAILLLALAAPAAAQPWTRHMGGAGSMEHIHMCDLDDGDRSAEFERCPLDDMAAHHSMMGAGMMGNMDMDSRHSMMGAGMMGGMDGRQHIMGSGTMSHTGEACDPAGMGHHLHRSQASPESE